MALPPLTVPTGNLNSTMALVSAVVDTFLAVILMFMVENDEYTEGVEAIVKAISVLPAVCA